MPNWPNHSLVRTQEAAPHSSNVTQIKIYEKRFHCIVIYYMGKYEKLLIKILRKISDANVPFDGLCSLLKHIGFEEILNLQYKGGKSKPYQVKQVRNIILKYKLGEIW
jgi:hypothetical protein